MYLNIINLPNWLSARDCFRKRHR